MTSNDSQSALTSAPQPRWRTVLSTLRRPRTIAVAIILALFAWQTLDTRSRIEQMQEELAKRLAEGDAVGKEARTLAKQNQDLLQALTAKVGALEAKQAEMQGQQTALDAMYQELSRSRDERLQADVEQAVNLAAQQLQVTGNVAAALIALQGAEARLARAGQPLLLPLRKLINRDIERLKALPSADVPGISLRLDGVIAAIDAMPLAHEQRPPATPVAANAAERSPLEIGYWQSLAVDFWNEVKQLIRIERMDRPAPALLSPPQSFFLRENLKLRLINARLALLQRDGRGFREDVSQSRAWLETYFDGRTRSVQTAAATLKDIAAIEIAQELPTLGETLAAVHAVRPGRDKGATK